MNKSETKPKLPKHRGRPLGSVIRQNVVDLMASLGEAYAYTVYKHYAKIFPKVTLRSVYYQLQKGLETGEFVVKRVQKEQGNYSWGTVAEKTYYGLGHNAKPRKNILVLEYFDNLKASKKE